MTTGKLLAAAELHISISAQPLFEVFGIPVTNSLLTGIIGSSIAIAILFYVASKIKKGKYNRFVGFVQWVFEGMSNQAYSVIPDREVARKSIPLVMTIFFFVIINYWMSIIPGPEAIFWNGVPVLRSLTADLNFTVGLALITVIAVQIYAVKQLGSRGNLGRYFRNPFKDFVGAFEGFLEIFGEISRLVALSLRLFGNTFAGEILLIVIAILAGYLASLALPIFMVFELFIGFIQAYVFFMLTLIFISLAVSHHGPEDTAHSTPDKAKKKLAAQS